MAKPRLLSHSEIQTALTCWARHAFAYTGHLTDGQTLRRREIPVVLSEGRAWGAGVARWHQQANTLLGLVDAAEAMHASLDADEIEMDAAGFWPSPERRVQAEDRLGAILAHYAQVATPLENLTRLEEEIVAPVLSRNSNRASTRYRFQCLLDGWTVDEQERPWLVEFKLRARLHSLQLIASSRQLRWYAWALGKAKGVDPVGVIVDERLNRAPAPPRIVGARRKGEGIDGRTVSHATDQQCTVEDYVATCERYDSEPNPATIEALNAIVWQQRHVVLFRPGELEEAGRELVSAARLIRDLDSGLLHPIRNVAASNCNGCRFREICANPEDEFYVDSLFERTTPKRDREETHEDRQAAHRAASERSSLRPTESGQDGRGVLDAGRDRAREHGPAERHLVRPRS